MRFTLTFLLSFFLTHSIYALRVEKLTVEQNLSNDEVLNITQDIDGAMWFQTEEGIDTFYGKQFYVPTSLDTFVSDSLRHNIRFIQASTQEPYLYISNERYGLSCYNIHTHAIEETPITIYLRRHQLTTISYICESGNDLWFTVEEHGIYRYDQTTHQITAYDQTLVPEFAHLGLRNLVVKNHMLYIGTWQQGFATFDTHTYHYERYTTHSTHGNLVDDKINAIEIMRNGSIWIGTSKGLSLFTGDTAHPFRNYSSDSNPQLVPNKVVYDIKETANGDLLVGVELHGIYRLSAGQMLRSGKELAFEQLQTDLFSISFREFSIRKIFQDCFNNIWIGTYGGGVGFISHEPSVFNLLRRVGDGSSGTSLSHAVAWGVCIDEQGQLWVGNDGNGIDVFAQGQRVANINKITDGIGMSVISAARDPHGILWFGTYQHGLFRVNPKDKKLMSVYTSEHKRLSDIRDITIDSQGHAWICTTQGLYEISSDGDIIQHYTVETSGLRSDVLRSSYIDSRGLLWIGYFRHGLQVFDLKTMQSLSIPSLSVFDHASIRNIIEDSHQQMWVASDQGLMRINIDRNGTNRRIYTQEEGLISNNIQTVIEYPQGVIWGSTTKGLVCIDLKDEKLFCYTEANAMKLHSFKKNSATHDSEHLYFGSSEGLWSFNPFQLLITTPAPKPIMTSCRRLGTTEKTFLQGKTTYIQPSSWTLKQPGFEVQFVIHDYAYHNRLTFQYQLVGADDTWYSLGNQQELVLRNLLPGNYTLKIRSMLDGDARNVSTSELKLLIRPPFWATWWFLLLSLALIVGIVWKVFQYSINQLRLTQQLALEKQAHAHENELNTERLKFYTDITHEIRTPLTLILGPLRDLLQHEALSGQIKKEIQVIYRSAQKLLNLTNMLIMFRKAENNKLVIRPQLADFAAFIEAQVADFRSLNRNKHVEVSFKCGAPLKPIYFDHAVTAIIITNLLSNALKHTREGFVLVEVAQDALTDHTVLKIHDSGDGISKEKRKQLFNRWNQGDHTDNSISNGIGLSIVKELVIRHAGTIEVQSIEGEGTTFVITLQTSHQYGGLTVPTTQSMTHAAHVIQPDEAKAAIPEAHCCSLKPSKSPKPEMLVVEDDGDIQEYIAHIFDDTYHVIRADDGEMALEMLKKHHIQIIISDYMMPLMDGIALCVAVKKEQQYASIPFILLTAIVDNKQRELGYQAGANSFLTKPFSGNLLRSRVANLMAVSNQEVTTNPETSTMQKKIHLRKNLSHLEQEFIDNVNSLIEENMSRRKVDVAFLADSLNMSHSTLYRRIKQMTGSSTNEYIRYIRLQKAESLLLQGSHTITEVSDLVGMATPDYFRQCFKEAFGVSPSEYVRSILS